MEKHFQNCKTLAMILPLCETTVLPESLMKALRLCQKHKRMPLPTRKSDSQFQGICGCSKTTQSKNPSFGLYYSHMGTQNCSIISTAFPALQTSNRLSCGQSDYSCRCLKYSSAGSLGTQRRQAENQSSSQHTGSQSFHLSAAVLTHNCLKGTGYFENNQTN